jgi:hypothetical protein
VHSDENEVFALLRQLDHPPRPVTMDVIAAQALRRRASRRWSWAAAILLTTVGGVAWAAPGSPVRGWIEAAVERLAGPPEIPGSGDPAPVPPPLRPGAGIAMPPGRELLIVISAPERGGTAHVVLSDQEEVVVRAATNAVAFTSERDRLLIETRAGTPDLDIAVPRTAARVEIRVGGTRLFLKKGRLVTATDSAGPDGPYHLSLHPRGEP